MSRRSDSPYFPKSTPRHVDGGIRAKSMRGRIANTWWSTRFIELLEAGGMGSRLTRGRNYARRGQVLSFDLDAGQVVASVQGSRARPYKVRIGIIAYGKADWARVEEKLSQDAWFVGQLLAGEMPPDIEQVFEDLGLTLFPAGDLSMDCSCPDWEVPCKHLAAVFYLLAERFEEDPFALLAWRGRDRDDLLAHLDAGEADAGADAAVPLTELLESFYVSSGDSGRVRSAATGASLLDQLPTVALTARGRPVVEVLRPAYGAMSGQDESIGGGSVRRRST